MQTLTLPKRALGEGVDIADTADLDDAVTDTAGMDEVSDGSADDADEPSVRAGGGADVAENDSSDRGSGW